MQRNHLGDVLEARGQLDAALAEYRKALEARRTLAAADPTNAQAQRDLSLSHGRVGNVLRKQGRWQEALVELEASLAIAQRLAADEPANREWQRELALAHLDVARVLDAQGRSDAALEALRGRARDRRAAGPRRAVRRRSATEPVGALLGPGAVAGTQGEPGGGAADLLPCQSRRPGLTNLEPDSGEWRERRTWVEERLRATHDGGPAPC